MPFHVILERSRATFDVSFCVCTACERSIRIKQRCLRTEYGSAFDCPRGKGGVLNH